MYYFYVIESNDGELYFGATKDLKRRLSEHASNRSYSTRNKQWQLIYYEAYRSEKDARRRETRIKLHGQAKRQLKDRIRESRLGQS